MTTNITLYRSQVSQIIQFPGVGNLAFQLFYLGNQTQIDIQISGTINGVYSAVSKTNQFKLVIDDRILNITLV